MALRAGRRAAPARSDAAAFEALLRGLDSHRDTAAEKYEEVRIRLRRFFVWRGARWPDELADETIDRVGRRLAEGEAIRAADVGRYFLGVARNVLREAWQRERRRPQERVVEGLGERIASPEDTSKVELDARFECLERCLAELDAESRQLLLRYYEGDGGARIESRRALAAGLGLPAGTLRIRLHRLRVRLEACVRRRMRARETSAHPVPPVDEGGDG